ncbi:MAG: polysaccharide deacetylase family protein [Schwartzia sp. (in: firmicutes)]
MSEERGFLGRMVLLVLGLCLFVDPHITMAAALPGVSDPAVYEKMREENDGRLAFKQRFITTTRQSVVFTFGGFSKEAPLRDILDKMAAKGWTGTFFVTTRELEKNGANLDLIAARGQDFGVAIHTKDTDDFYSICAQIDYVRNGLRERYGIETTSVRHMGGPESPALQEAVAALGCELYGQSLNVVQGKHKDAKSPAEVMPDIFGKWTTSLGRGQLVYLRTDFYTHEMLAGEMMMEVWKKKIDNIAYRAFGDSPETNPHNDSAYAVESIREVLADKDKLWQYPVDPEKILPELRPDYVPFPINDQNFAEEFYKRYLGASDVNERDRMTEFSRSEMIKADKTGVVKTVPDNAVFFTFDDWGCDDSVNHLLYVLRKHKVPGTFFIITLNMPNNPNLLRAIAADGQEIGSHTNSHKAMNRRDARGHQVAVMGKEEYAADVRESFLRLSDTIGDMVVGGRPALTRLMRPPTLAVSRSGVRANFDAGFTYIVSGESTSDYAQPNLSSMVAAMQNAIFNHRGKVRKGIVLVMHMSATAKFTAKAVDLMLTANEQRPDGDPAKFRLARLDDYLTGDYSQIKHHVPAVNLR